MSQSRDIEEGVYDEGEPPHHRTHMDFDDRFAMTKLDAFTDFTVSRRIDVDGIVYGCEVILHDPHESIATKSYVSLASAIESCLIVVGRRQQTRNGNAS